MLKVAFINVEAMTADEFQSLLPHASEERRLFLKGWKSTKNKYTSLAGEVLAKLLLSKESGCPAAKLEIKRSANGKPYSDIPGLFFNISHSDYMVMCAIADEEIGVDLQKVKKYSAKFEKNVLSKAEEESAPAGLDARNKYITDIWCKKESYYKYTGSGIIEKPKALDTKEILEKQQAAWYCSELPHDYCYAICKKAVEEPVFIEVDLAGLLAALNNY